MRGQAPLRWRNLHKIFSRGGLPETQGGLVTRYVCMSKAVQFQGTHQVYLSHSNQGWMSLLCAW